MTIRKPFALKARLGSFRYAFAGIRTLLITQHNARIHALATVLVCGVGALLALSLTEWCFLVLAITAVWVAEALNSALEFLADALHPEQHPKIKQAKDVAAAAVLAASLGAAIIGLLVFAPHLLRLISPP